jgi:tetratricopeptide (TPR) repeat protein
LAADIHWFSSMLDLACGRIDAAGRSLARAVESERAAPAEHRRQAYEAVTEWFAATLPLPYADSTLQRVRQRAESFRAPAGESRAPFVNELRVGSPIQLEPVRQYTLGTLSLRLRDTASARAAAARLERLAASGGATSLVRDLDRGLRARLAFAERRPGEALLLLEALEARDSQGDIAVTPFVTRANERYLRGEVLTSLGRDVEALRWFASLGVGSVTEIPLQALSHLRRAELHERLGDRAQAVRHYRRFLELWRDADPELRPVVDDARRRLERLAGAR